MNNSLGSKTNTRDTEKCSACRHRKKKCSPHDRDWENSQQKCNFCETHGLQCGPNVRYGEDPAVIRHRAVVSETAGSNQAREREQHPEGSIAWPAPDIPAPAVHGTEGNIEGPPNASRFEDGTKSLATLSIEDLEEKALSKLHEFHALENALAYVSQPTLVYCQVHGSQQLCHDLSIEERLHDLFINIYLIGVEANTRKSSHLARWILFALVFALDQYPPLFDKRKRNYLLKIALMFQELGHRWGCEHVLLKISRMYKNSVLPSQGESFQLLANSLSTSSMSVRCVLVNRWGETVGGNHPDSNLNVPPLHAAVQHRNPSIIMALLSNSDDPGSSSIAPSPLASPNVGQARVNINERDLNNQTALFAAVASGDESSCFTLLCHGADANTRDDHGHTALEVAVRGGYYNIVKSLIEFNASVNPDLAGCSSLPLHAAIESGNLPLEIIHHLLNSGANADLRRPVDNKNAIDVAVDRGYQELAESMRLMTPSLNQTNFMIRDPSMNQIVF